MCFAWVVFACILCISGGLICWWLDNDSSGVANFVSAVERLFSIFFSLVPMVSNGGGASF